MESQSELDETDSGSRAPDRNSIAGPPRWVKIFGFIAIIILLTVAVLHLTTGGFMHHTQPSKVHEPATQPP